MKLLPALPIWVMIVFAIGLSAGAEEFDSGGVKIHYAIEGKGEPVILIHGLYANARMNWDLPGITKELAKQYQVIALDNRGHGLSGKPTSADQYGTNMVDDIVRLMDHLHIPKARLVGYSMGGMITLKLLTLHPERVSSAVLGGMGWLRPDSAEQKFWEGIPRLPGQNAPVACMHGMAKLAVTEAEVKAVRVPVTIVIGDADPCRKMYVEPLKKVRPDWPEHVIEKAGHLDCLGKPDFKVQLKAALESKPVVKPGPGVK